MPFNFYRLSEKQRKAMFAGLTLLCMVTFILTGSMTGRGDFFDWLQTAFGGEGRIPQVATVYGNRVDQLEIQTLREQRLLANEYMMVLTQLARSQIYQEILKSMDKFKGFEQQLRTILQFGEQLAAVPEFSRQYLGEIQKMYSSLEALGKKEEAALLAQLAVALERAGRHPPNAPYFGGSLDLQGLLDFLIWRHQADRLGIQLTRADVENEVRGELPDRASNEIFRQAERYLAQVRRMPMGQNLVTALENEFRVRLAQAALLGYEPGDPTRVPAPITPYEFWEYYRHNRTEVTVAVLPLAVESFLPQVKEEPTEEDLRKLFEAHKEQEYAPESPTPGFKKPREVQVEWVSGKADSAHYRKAADIVAAALQATLPFAVDLRLLGEYDNLKRSQFRAPSKTDPWAGPEYPLQEASLNQPAAVAALVGGALAATRESPFLALAAYQTVAVSREVRDRLRTGSNLILAAASPTPFLAAGLAYENLPRDEFLPLKAVRDKLLDRLEQGLAQDLVTGNLNTVKKELDSFKSLGEAVRREKARKYLAEALVRYGLSHGNSGEARDRFDISADKGLVPLKESYLRTQRQDPKARQFAGLFFDDARTFEAQKWPTDRSFRGMGDDWQWQTDAEPFLYWKTADEKAEVPSFNAVRDQVVRAWKLEKARALAQARAKEVAEKVQKTKGDPVPVLTDAAQKPNEPFNLYLVSRLQSRPSALFNMTKQYEPYRVPEDRIEYPPADFVDRVLALKEKGDTAVLTDRPEAHVYVAALLNRIEPTMQEFVLRYKEASPTAFQQDSLYDRFEQEQREKYREAILTQLREDAKLTIKEGAARRLDEPAAGEE